jgi:hypothetical protein
MFENWLLRVHIRVDVFSPQESASMDDALIIVQGGAKLQAPGSTSIALPKSAVMEEAVMVIRLQASGTCSASQPYAAAGTCLLVGGYHYEVGSPDSGQGKGGN